MPHLIPFFITCALTGGLRQATDDEIEDYKKNPTNKANLTKWMKANRIEYAKKLLQDGEAHNVAWTKAFDRYPDLSSTPRPRFVMK